MAKKPTDSQPQEPELRPDGWQRFEGAVDAAINSGPQGKTATAIGSFKDFSPIPNAIRKIMKENSAALAEITTKAPY